jgi:pyroglutamyl-peptidase
MVQPRILLTGFTPFGDVEVNPTELLMQRIDERVTEFPGVAIETAVLDTHYTLAEDQLRNAIDLYVPDAILSFGLRMRRDELFLERIAINVDDAALPDTGGTHRQGQRIVEQGPVAYWSTLPLEQIYAALEKTHIPVRMSNHAGAYLCNHIFYFTRHLVESTGLGTLAGFIHVPPFPEQVQGQEGRSGMDLQTLFHAAQICVHTVAATLSG